MGSVVSGGEISSEWWCGISGEWWCGISGEWWCGISGEPGGVGSVVSLVVWDHW